MSSKQKRKFVSEILSTKLMKGVSIDFRILFLLEKRLQNLQINLHREQIHNQDNSKEQTPCMVKIKEENNEIFQEEEFSTSTIRLHDFADSNTLCLCHRQQ